MVKLINVQGYKSHEEGVKSCVKAATARIKQRGAEAIDRYYSSSDGKYYANYQAAVDARKERLAQLSKDQAAAKKKPPGQPTKPPVRVATPQQEMRQKINQNRSSSGGRNGKPTISASSGETGSTAQKLQINS